jgi:hypothetical protein
MKAGNFRWMKEMDTKASVGACGAMRATKKLVNKISCR